MWKKWYYILFLGDDCLTTEPRRWYECSNGNVSAVYEYPGLSLTNPDGVPVWIYTHFALNVLWMVAIFAMLQFLWIAEVLIDSSSNPKGSYVHWDC